MDMKKLTKHLRIRLTEEQVKKLADTIINEQENKSTVVRIALDNYLDGTDSKINKQNKNKNKDKKTLK
jgi:hypothetical protein